MTNLLQQAITAHQANNLPEAERLYRSVLAAMPEQADALALLGVICGTKGAHDEAISLTEKAVALDERSALFRFHQGSVLMNAKKLPQAIAAFRQALALQPGMAQAWYNLGNALRAADDWTGALDAYRQAIKYNSQYVEAYNNLALTLVHEKQFDEALEQAKKSVAIAPNYGEGWRTLCNIAEGIKNYSLAVEAGEHCIRLMPDSHYSWFGYGVALNRLDRHEEAITAYKNALEFKPDRADIWDNLGQTYQSLNRLDEAEATFRKTVEIAGQVIPDEDTREVAEEEYGHRHWHLALMELLRGKFKQGFARYRARFKDVGGLQRPNFSRPLWKGENLAGKTILVTDEQGFGDTLMLCRYLPLMKKRGAKIIFSVHPVLENLFKGWPGADTIIVHGTRVPAYDYYTSVFDLPHHFGTTIETVPSEVPYLPLLQPDEGTLLDESGLVPLPLREGLGEGALNNTNHRECGVPPHLTSPARGEGQDGLLKIGVVWGGSPLHTNDSRRSVPLPLFAKLFEEQGAQFYSLNRDIKPGDVELLPRYPLIDLVPRIKDFADAARFIIQLDLVITCDTATAHLAGGLGKPVWILLPFAPDWRWLTGRSDSVWYPTARLFRQARVGDWEGIIMEAKKAISLQLQGER